MGFNQYNIDNHLTWIINPEVYTSEPMGSEADFSVFSYVHVQAQDSLERIHVLNIIITNQVKDHFKHLSLAVLQTKIFYMF